MNMDKVRDEESTDGMRIAVNAAHPRSPPRMRLLFVNRFYSPDISATSQILTGLAEHLARVGHEVHVVCSRQLYEDASAVLAPFELRQGVQVHRAWSSRFGRGSLAGRAADYLTFYVGAWWQLRRLVDSATIVVAKTDPPLISVVTASVTMRRGAVLVNWLQDVFPEVATHLGLRGLSGTFGKLLMRVRDWSLRSAAVNVVLGDRMAALIASRGIGPERICIVPNWSDAERLAPIDRNRNALRREWAVGAKFVVMYSGNMGRAHEFDTMLDAAAALKEHEQIEFLFVGGGAKSAQVAAAAAARGLSNVRFLPYQPVERLGESLSAGDLHLVSLLPTMEGLIVPSKFYGILAVGRPVVFIGSHEGELAGIVTKHNVGTVVGVGQPEALVQTILVYLSDANTRSAKGRNARTLFEMEYTQQSAIGRWERLLASIGEDAGRSGSTRAPSQSTTR
jgi:glycosyltransferase involved in cell wall biosynthesis